MLPNRATISPGAIGMLAPAESPAVARTLAALPRQARETAGQRAMW